MDIEDLREIVALDRRNFEQMQEYSAAMQGLIETAALAHLNLGDEELAAAFPAFEQMLGYFAAMQGADADSAAFPQGAAADGGLPAAGCAGAGRFRGDCPNPGAENPPGLSERLLDNAGERDGRFIVIPNVL
jgi:aspartyl-tRNA(Asn)/glutamyl-tRNA(Gln) amidotransferase subunit C